MITWKWMPRFLYQQSEWGREQDSRETERESMCERQCVGEGEG